MTPCVIVGILSAMTGTVVGLLVGAMLCMTSRSEIHVHTKRVDRYDP
jgi:hypothetical protein